MDLYEQNGHESERASREALPPTRMPGATLHLGRPPTTTLGSAAAPRGRAAHVFCFFEAYAASQGSTSRGARSLYETKSKGASLITIGGVIT
jgi:hypothetical protein